SSLLAFGDYNGAVHLWDVGQGRETRVIKTAQHNIQSLAFSPDGQLVAAGTQDLLVRAWAVRTGELKHTFPKLNTPARLITFRPDDKMVAAVGDDCVVHVWHIPPGNEARMFKHNGQVRSIAFSPDSAVLAIAGEDKVVGLWDPNTGAYRGALEGHAKTIDAIAFLPGGKTLISGSGDGTMRVWDVAATKELRRIAGVNDGVGTFVVSRDGNTVFATTGHAIRAFDIASGKEQHPANGHEKDVYGVAFTPDGKGLVSGGSDCRSLVWDLATAR